MTTLSNKNLKRAVSLALAFALILGTLFVANIGIDVSVKAADSTAETAVAVATATTATYDAWDGTAADGFASGEGTADSPYIIATAEQLYKMVLDGGKKSDGTAAYYKVSDGITAFHLSDSIDKTDDEIKTVGAALNYSGTAADNKNWVVSADKLQAFIGHFDGNGVTIKGMISTGDGMVLGFIPWLGRGAVVKNITFDGCYVAAPYNSTDELNKYVGLLSSKVTAYNDANQDGTTDGDSVYGTTLVYSVAVINSYIESLNVSGGIVASSEVPDGLQFLNCMFDGVSSSFHSWKTANACGIYAHSGYGNNFELHSCVSIDVKLSNNHQQGNYNDYSNPSTTKQHPIYILDSYSVSTTEESYKIVNNNSDAAFNNETTDIALFDATDDYDYQTNLPLLDWVNAWELTTLDGRNIPMPKTDTRSVDYLALDGDGRAILDYDTLMGEEGVNGANIGAGPYETGTYGYFYNLIGWGTKDEPYLIEDAVQLARAISSGGVNLQTEIYYKLENDIDLQGFRWLDGVGNLDTASGESTSTYVPFHGHIDGDGHCVTGLYAVAGNDSLTGSQEYMNQAALIPVVDGGTVKNLHVRDAYAATGSSADDASAGAIVATIIDATTIEGCSIENCTVNGQSKVHTIGGGSYTIKNTFFVSSDGTSSYYGADGSVTTSDAIKLLLQNGDESALSTWYIGGAEGSIPKLINRAKAMPTNDIDGDGLAEERNTAADAVALRGKLLQKSAFAYIYGDVNGDGKINIADLAILKREMAGDYADIEDGFWRNVELGNVDIYYGDNDNYDAARKIELYLEMLYPSVDFQKHIVTDSDNVHPGDKTGKTPDGAADGRFDIIIGDIADTYVSGLSENKYKVVSSVADAYLWIQGANFTAVEQAVYDWMTDSYLRTGTTTMVDGVVVEETELADYKKPVTVGGTTYYYSWGEEFDAVFTSESNLNRGIWFSDMAASESWKDSYDAEGNLTAISAFHNIENTSATAVNKLLNVENGKLTMARGYRQGITLDGVTYTDVTSNGMIPLTADEIGTYNGYFDIDNDEGDEQDLYFVNGTLSTSHSMLFKQGYVEILASLPADGHAFPALWLYGTPGGNLNSNTGWDYTLYSKVYKLNNSENNSNPDAVWNGQDAITGPTNLAEFKYQVPSIYYEVDMLELMQDPANLMYSRTAEKHYNPILGDVDYTTGSYWTTAVGSYDITSVVHKWYSNGLVRDTSGNVLLDKFYARDWANGTTQEITYGKTTEFTSADSEYYTFGGNYKSYLGVSDYLTGEVNEEAIANTQKWRKYGFLWDITDGTTTLKLYVYEGSDNSDTAMASTNVLKEIAIDLTGDENVADNVYSDTQRLNAYMYVLLDNKFYSYNTFNGFDTIDTEAKAYTDMLTTVGKTTLDVEYVRIYQKDNKRDIVLAETESFNNGNHFGY